MRSSEPGPLTTDEQQLLDALLAHDFPGVEALRVQSRAVEARKGCSCGCGTIDLIPLGTGLPRSTADSPLTVEGSVHEADDAEVGGLLLFLSNGFLSSLEVYSFGEPLPLPVVDRVRW